MSSLLMLSALLLGGDPPAVSGDAYYVQTPVLQYSSAAHYGAAADNFGAYQTNSFDGRFGWGYATGNYSGLCPVTRRAQRTMGIWDNYCWETALCGCCGHENGSAHHILFCDSQRGHGCGSCGQPAANCGCGGHGYDSHAGHDHDGAHNGIIIEQGDAIDGDIVPPAPGAEAGVPAADGVTIKGRYDDFLLEPGEERTPANAPWIRNTNLRTKPMESADPPLRNWLFPRTDKPSLPPIEPSEKISDSAPPADPFFTGQKQ